MHLVINRIIGLFIKEVLALLRDPKGRVVLIGPPLLQLIIFSYAATLEVKNVSLAIYNQDTGAHAQELTQRLIGAPTFKTIIFVARKEEIKALIDNQKVIGAIHIPDDFSASIDNNSPLAL